MNPRVEKSAKKLVAKIILHEEVRVILGFCVGFRVTKQVALQRLYKGWEVSGGRLVTQFIRRNVILVHCTAQTEPLQSDAGVTVDDEDFDAGSSIHYIYISTSFRAVF